MRFAGTCFRAHDPRWAFQPLSGQGAAVRGARFNRKGQPALYLALSLETAILEANQGFGSKINPCTLCSYEVDCENIVDLRDAAAQEAANVALSDMGGPWALDLARGNEPASWRVARHCLDQGVAGILVPSFAVGAGAASQNLALWRWGEELPHRVLVNDPQAQLPKDQKSWK